MKKKLLTIIMLLTLTTVYGQIEINFDGVALPPPAGWSTIYNEGSSPILTLISPDRKSTINVSVSDYNGSELDVGAKKVELIEQLSKSMTNIIIDGSGKDFIEYRAVQNREQYGFYQKHIIIDRRLFIFTYTSPSERYLGSRQTFLELLNQFRAINQRS